MKWNWQLPRWPNFEYSSECLLTQEETFLREAGKISAILKYSNEKQKKEFVVEILCTEGLKSAAIEGEILERESLQSSIQKNLGLNSESSSLYKFPKEQGMAKLLCEVYENYEAPLNHEMLYRWHSVLMAYNSQISDKGKYRSHEDPMQIVSNRHGSQKVYFEAPPASLIKKEMSQFIKWFNHASQKGPILGNAAIAHLYFEAIHPFEDGNGRIGRALSEKLLSRRLKNPTLITLSKVIESKRNIYYEELVKCNKTLAINDWVHFFAEIILSAQKESIALIDFLIQKSKMLTILAGKLNNRQEKVLLRMFTEGVKGFAGGLSAENYISITKTSRATATRDLTDLVFKKALKKTGELKSTRYWLNLGSPSNCW